jgi:3-hydroxybutyryl-CoA dehydrogenase
VLKKIGKHPVFCKDTPGFIHNYLQHGLIKAALELLENQAASPEDIDRVVRNGFGLRLASVGPIQFLDMCGLDTVNNVSKYLYKTTGNPTYKPFKAIEEKISQGDLGVKTGKGFFEYETAGSTEFWQRTNREIIRILKAFAHRSPE